MSIYQKLNIGNIPALLWGKPVSKVYIYVHGKGGSKAEAENFAALAKEKGFQVLSYI